MSQILRRTMNTTTTTSPFNCLLVGADSLLLECGAMLLERGRRIVAVAAGSTRVEEWALANGLRTFPATTPARQWADALNGEVFDWLFSITHLSLLADEVIGLATSGAINFHDGPLPGYAGLNAPAWAILRGEQSYGISWHILTSGIDTGDLVKQRSFDLGGRETSVSLNTSNFEVAIETFSELIDDIDSGRLTRTVQDPAVERHVYSRHDRPRSMAVLDWDRPAEQLDRLVRALDFGRYPNPLGIATMWTGDDFVLVTAAEARLPSLDVMAERRTPGVVAAVSADAVEVDCSHGSIVLTALSTLAGEPLAISDFVESAGLRRGIALPRLNDADRDLLDDLGAALARHERFHLQRLESLSRPQLPWVRAESELHPQARRSARESRDLELSGRRPAVSDATMAAALSILLTRFSDTETVHIAFADERIGAGVPERWSGLVSSVVPLELSNEGDPTCAELITRMDEELAMVRSHGTFTRLLVARHPALHRDADLARGAVATLALRLDGVGEPPPGAIVEITRRAGTWSMSFDADLMDADDADIFLACLSTTIEQLLAHPESNVSQIDIVSEDQRVALLETWNDTTRAVPGDRCIHELFEEQADRTPDAVAVVCAHESMTYRQLDERSNQLADILRDFVRSRDQLVGIHLERGLDLMAAILAVHKAGAAYLPLDPSFPLDRLRHMLQDSGCALVVTEARVAQQLSGALDDGVVVVDLDIDRARISARSNARRPSDSRPEDLAYCIYTSGSTGSPKGVLVEHRNVVNFFVAMDDRVPHPSPDAARQATPTPATWLAVTSLSFDISVLELLYTVTRGFTVIVRQDWRDSMSENPTARTPAVPDKGIQFSLFYFSGDEAEHSGSDKYRLLIEGARWADSHEFCAVWTPERHFHAFGGLYPQPAITGAAVAAVTERIAVRAGSVVMPLHHPIRVAEAWSVVDNLSNGRVGISVASGWQPEDFVLMPENYAAAKAVMFENLETVKRLWRGEFVEFSGVSGAPVKVRTLPRPVQQELPVWVTTAGNPDTYVQAGRIGANVLTHLLGQSVEQLAPKIAAYRAARLDAGFDPDGGVVTLMLHTFVGQDPDQVREIVKGPLKTYLGTSMSLLKEYAGSFPAFQKPAEGGADWDGSEFSALDDDERDAILEFAYLRYYESSGLFGTPQDCRPLVQRLKGIGINEIACLIDFGVPTDLVLDSFIHLDALRRSCNDNPPVESAAAAERHDDDQSFAAQVRRHRVSHLQCTPSLARLLTMDDESRVSLGEIDNLFIGGEAFPVSLANSLVGAAPGELAHGTKSRVMNMYGPTETTIWSTTWEVQGPVDSVPIGAPIANTQVYVLDRHRRLLPPGAIGQLWIGGEGVVRGYHNRPELTCERFVTDPFSAPFSAGAPARMYDTGDRASWGTDASGVAVLEYHGRADHQVKIRGHRIELGEIETQLQRVAGVADCVAHVSEHHADQQLVAYVVPSGRDVFSAHDARDALRLSLPEVMVPTAFVILERMPRTPNGKVDRSQLPAPEAATPRSHSSLATAPPTSDLEAQVLAIWVSLLGTPDIGVDDNFFDVGGHSLLVVRLHRQLRDLLSRPVALTDIYRSPTVRSFVASCSPEAADARSGSRSGLERAARRRDTLGLRRRGE